MEQQIQKFKELIEASEQILITSHISPDPDAMASALLMSATLQANFGSKVIKTVMEEEPSDLAFMPHYDQAEFKPVYEALEGFKPDLLILLDGNNYERFSRHDGQKIRDFITSNNLKTVVIDHHEETDSDTVTLSINNASAAVVQDVYELLFDSLKLIQPADSAQLSMIGFYADTGGFVYIKPGNEKKVFGFAEELVGQGASVEEAKNQLEQYSEDDMLVLSELMANVTLGDDYTYSFLSDSFLESWLTKGMTYPQLDRPTSTFSNSYIRNIEGRKWGFITYKNPQQGDNFYSVSFRSQNGNPDVAAMATELGGGGHKPAAGAKFEATSLDEAIAKVKAVIQAKTG